MKPHRIRMAHNLVGAYGLLDKMDVFVRTQSSLLLSFSSAVIWECTCFFFSSSCFSLETYGVTVEGLGYQAWGKSELDDGKKAYGISTSKRVALMPASSLLFFLLLFFPVLSFLPFASLSPSYTYMHTHKNINQIDPERT